MPFGDDFAARNISPSASRRVRGVAPSGGSFSQTRQKTWFDNGATPRHVLIHIGHV